LLSSEYLEAEASDLPPALDMPLEPIHHHDPGYKPRNNCVPRISLGSIGRKNAGLRLRSYDNNRDRLRRQTQEVRQMTMKWFCFGCPEVRKRLSTKDPPLPTGYALI
jgi:hypothetical protein